MRNRQRDRDHSLAWNRALAALREKYEEEFRSLYDQERYEIEVERAIWGEVSKHKGHKPRHYDQDGFCALCGDTWPCRAGRQRIERQEAREARKEQQSAVAVA